MTTLLIKSNYLKYLDEWEDRAYGPKEFPKYKLNEWDSYRVIVAFPNKVSILTCPAACMKAYLESSTEGVDYLILH